MVFRKINQVWEAKKHTSWRNFKRRVSDSYVHLSIPVGQRNLYSSNASQRNIEREPEDTADTALRLSKFFGNSPRFWLGLQNDFDLEEEGTQKENELNEIKPIQGNAT